jgi:hypothetical protein
MEASRLDRVRVQVDGDIIEISWAERDALLNHLAYVAGSQSVRGRFEAVGASGSRAVDLTPDDRWRLRVALDDWDRDMLKSDGISRLRDALVRADPSGGPPSRPAW